MATPSDIIAGIPRKFELALSAGDLFFFPSTVHVHNELDVSWEIRLCPALQKKPTLPQPDLESNPESLTAVDNISKDKKDPFSPPYVPNLHVGNLSDGEEELVVLLNKYSIIEHHFLLVSKEFQSQSSPLYPFELLQTFELLQAAKQAGHDYFAFFNCGDLSGASQPHKHLQLIPLQSPGGPPIEQLARTAHLDKPNKPFSLTKLPYANHVYRLPSDMASLPREQVSEILTNAFLALIDLGVSTIRHTQDYPKGRPSYNVIMTREHIHLIPRGKETFQLSSTGDHISINALGFAGMLLVKSEVELEAVKGESIAKILQSVGLESVHDQQVDGSTVDGE